MPNESIPLYVRLAAEAAGRLEQAVSASGRSKRQIVEDAVRAHLSDEGLAVGRVALREQAPEVLTPGEAAALLRVQEADVVAAAEAGELPGRRVGSHWRFSRAGLLAWLDASAAAGEPA